MNPKFYFVVLYVIVSCSFSFCWSSTINGMFRPKTIFPISSGFSTNLVESIAYGAQMAMDECKNVFKWDRWNCPQSSFSKQIKHLATKEIAYTEAIVAAGIVHAISRNCSGGEINGCGCDPNLSEAFTDNNTHQLDEHHIEHDDVETDWSWGGCSDNTNFGVDVVTKYLELDKNNDVQALVSRQNNKIGRQIIKDTMIKRCRCHGVSGSCTLQTCWKQVAPFSQIAIKLRQNYERAIKFSFDQSNGAVSIGNTVRQVPQIENNSVFNNLVYLEDSPDYCKADESIGWPGTKGRICSKTDLQNATIQEKRSCRKLCRSCGYRVRKQKRRITSRCNCKFMWCCEVKCDVCIENVDEYFCD